MRPHLILLLTLPLLGASCTGTSSTTPKPPPEMAPKDIYRIEWDTSTSDLKTVVRPSSEFTMAVYEVGKDSYGGEFRRLALLQSVEEADGGVIYAGEESGPFSPLADGLEIWAKDITWNKRYGGRIFRLFIPAKPGVSPEGIPTLNWPEESEITVEVVNEWPWGGTDPLTKENAPITLTYETTPVAPPGVYCLQKEWSGTIPIGPGAWLPYAAEPKNWMQLLHWVDGGYFDKEGRGSGVPIYSSATAGYYDAVNDGQPHSYVVFVRDGDYPSYIRGEPDRSLPHYNTWYRIFVKDFWGRQNPDGSVTCDGGMAGFEEVTDPEATALLNEYVENPPPDGHPLDEILLPTPWR